MTEKDEFLKVCSLCVTDATVSGKVRYVRRAASGRFILSGIDDNEGWLFQAYPGGRKTLSREGAAIAEYSGGDNGLH